MINWIKFARDSFKNSRITPFSHFTKAVASLCVVLSPSLTLRGSESSFWRSKHCTSICRYISMYRVLILFTALLANAGIHAVKIQIEKPEWPLNYKVVFFSSKIQLNYEPFFDKWRSIKIVQNNLLQACVRHKTDREFITVGWYVDTEGQRMRLDSYGIPKGLCRTKLNPLQIRNIVVNIE